MINVGKLIKYDGRFGRKCQHFLSIFGRFHSNFSYFNIQVDLVQFHDRFADVKKLDIIRNCGF